MSVFETLNAIDVNEHIEKKNGLSYLSWAWAWATVKKVYPTANYKVYEQERSTGKVNYFDDGITAYVHTAVTIEGETIEQMLPIMDNRNKSIPLANITSFNVNTSIQRCITKNLAMFGLGLYIYAGEDLPESVEEEKPKLNFYTLPQQAIDTLVKGAKAKNHTLTQADVDKYIETLAQKEKEKYAQ